MAIKFNKLFLTTFLFAIFLPSYASSFLNNIPHQWYVQGNVGMSLQKASGTNFISSGQPGYADSYEVSSLANATTFGLEGGLQFPRATTTPWFANYQLGLRYQQNLSAALKGTVTQYSAAAFLNYDYNYNIASQKLLLMGRADIYTWKGLSPFVELGLGYELRSVSAYSETALPGVDNPRQSPAFSSSTGGGLSYLYGLGVRAKIKPNFWLALSADMNGSASYKTGSGVAPAAPGVSLSNSVASQTILLSVGYLFK
jgi:opacity protein-like surface antigen